MLGRLEESILLAAMICGPQATVDVIKAKLDESIGERAYASVITTLDRLQDKGMVCSESEAECTGRRGQKKRRLFEVTEKGMANAKQSISTMQRLALEAGVDRVA